MAIKIVSTRNYAMDGVKVLVMGPAGIGKTVLNKTAPSPIIISAEAGLLSLADVDVPAIEVSTVSEVMGAYEFLTDSKEAEQFKTIGLDSISEIAEVLLTEYKKINKDPRAAYGQLIDDMTELIRHFRDIKGKHVYFTAKELKVVEDGSGLVTYKGSMPGNKLLNHLPYFFDEVFAMRLGKLEDGTVYRYLQTQKDLNYCDIKDRSGKLGPQEKPDLTYIFNKIAGKEEIKEEEEIEEKETKTEKEKGEKE